MVEPGSRRVADAEARPSTARSSGTAMASISQVRSLDESRTHTMNLQDVELGNSYPSNLMTPCAPLRTARTG